MDQIIVNPTPTSEWHELVKEASKKTNNVLSDDVESYIVFTLMRFSNTSDFLESIIAIDFLESLYKVGSSKYIGLKDIGDKCLLFSGLFPEHAEHRCVNLRYYVDIGQNAYFELSQLHMNKNSELFNHLSQQFVQIMDIMCAMRETPVDFIDFEKMHRMYLETGSRFAHDKINELASNILIFPHIKH